MRLRTSSSSSRELRHTEKPRELDLITPAFKLGIRNTALIFTNQEENLQRLHDPVIASETLDHRSHDHVHVILSATTFTSLSADDELQRKHANKQQETNNRNHE